ncbi:unnamed protein product [Cylindrotheca closterium]|uniref:Uncharacterized protein n=1 Tax=Cylindrotheca closterium TaxID=2856 RepID=A0AAD2FF86_9STRA|nr:unnamed protein product [Cylindrotheca closterium]
MFAPRSTVMPSSSNTSVSFRPIVSNENAMNTTASTKQAASLSTPGASMKRRAFGDISNKKPLASGSKSNGGNQNNVALKKAAFTPRSNLQQKPLLPKSTSKQPTSSNIRKPLAASMSNLAPTSVTKKPSQNAVLPRATSTAVNSGKKKTVVFETVDDVELPAGRLFSQQLENEEDDITELSDQEFIDNMWSDFGTSFRKQYKEDCLKEDQELDLQVQQHMDDFLRKEKEMKGIDSLLDLVDGIDLLEDQENLTALVEDDADTWSQPASSVFGDDILDDSLLL